MKEKKDLRKEKIDKILYHAFWFIMSAGMTFVLYDLCTHNKYGMGDYYNIKALIISSVICFVFMFGNACIIYKQDKDIEDVQNAYLKLLYKISPEEWRKIQTEYLAQKNKGSTKDLD